MCKKRNKNDLKVECWNLDFYLIKWLNEHLKCYLEDASGIVALEQEKFRFKGKIMTFKEVLERLIYITDTLYNNGDYVYYNANIKKVNALKNEMYDLLKLAHWQLWW